VLAVRWYLRFTISYRDIEELLAERGVVEVDHTTLYRWSSASRRCWLRPLGPAGTPSGTAGAWTRRRSANSPWRSDPGPPPRLQHAAD
jgi:hypothetical protein